MANGGSHKPDEKKPTESAKSAGAPKGDQAKKK